MKKIFGRILLLVLALTLVFSLAACDGAEREEETPTYPNVNNAGDAIGGAATVMEKKNGFVINVEATVTLPYIANLQYGAITLGTDTATVLAEVTMKKTKAGYDYVADGTVSAMLGSGFVQATVPFHTVKKGDTVYTQKSDGSWKTEPAESIDVSLNEVAKQIDAAVDGFEYGGFAKEEDGYSLTSAADYTEYLQTAQTVLKQLSPSTVNALVTEVAADMDYTVDEFIDYVCTVIEEAGEGAIDIQEVRDYIEELVADDEATIGELVDGLAEMYDESLRASLAYVAYTDVVDGALLSMANIEKYTIGENSVSAKLTLNKDLTVKNISFITKNYITYNEQKFVHAAISAKCDFSYTGMKAIVAPSV